MKDAISHRELRARCTEIVERRKEGKQPCGRYSHYSRFHLPAEHLVHVVGPDCRAKSR